ncbi:MAG: EamA family transporter RarD [Rhodospirillales bacterium]
MTDTSSDSGVAKAPLPDRAGLIGGLCALGAFGTWGFLPVYFKYMQEVSPLEILAHRIVWSTLLVGVMLRLLGRWPEIIAILENKRLLLWLCLSSILLSCNWMLFIWAVTNGFMLEGSLGYYINPLVNVLLGVVLLGERLTKAQWLAVALSLGGVTVLAVGLGAFPWIAVSLALLFGFYGYVRKTAPVGAATGLFVETLVVLIPAILYLVYIAWQGTGAMGTISLGYDFLLVFAGVVTAAPLIMFTAAARRLRYATVGFFQYLAPTLQFLLAVLVYGEAFTDTHKITFALIWTALAIYSADTFLGRRKKT